MLDFKKIYEGLEEKPTKLKEDAMVAAAPAGGGEIAAADSGANGADLTPPEHGTSAEDVLGKCDHKHDGYLGPKCFHVPKRVGKLHKRIELPGTKKKKGQKNPYTDNAVLLSDAELTQDMIVAARQMSKAAITKFIKDEYNCAPDDGEIRAIAYFPEKKICFIKFKKDGKWAYAAADFDGEKFIMKDSIEREILTSKQVNELYAGIGKIKPWIIWGEA